MKNSLLKYCSILVTVLLFSCNSGGGNFRIYDLKVQQPFSRNDRDTLHSIPVTFSWKTEAIENGWTQKAYQLIVSKSEEISEKNRSNIWNSGKIESGNQLFVPYTGPSLAPGEKYFWKVKVWQTGKKDADWSQPESFYTQLLLPDNWKGKWITYTYDPSSPMPLFRKSFQISNINEVVSARLYVSGLGYYEAYLNGKKIGDHVLDPGQTNYDDYAFYSAYDIPLEDIYEKNAIGIMLGDGWYNQNLVWNKSMSYGQPVLNSQLIVLYENGKSDTIATDNSWKWKEGPLTSSNIYAGETYDANKEITSWSSYNCNDEDWNNAAPATKFPPGLIEQQMEPIRRMDSLSVVRILKPEKDKWIFDFGQNFAGWVRLKIEGEKNQLITLRFSEEIDSDNNIDPVSTGTLATSYVQTDQYVCKGGGTETWEPRFTYHGFRYVEVTGLEDEPDKDLLTGIVVYSSMKKAGEFSCSDPQINRLHDMAVWTLLSNVHSLPTDCPHRERCGWTGDAHTMAKSLIQNFDSRLFLTKYMYDVRSSGRQSRNMLCFGRDYMERTVVPKPAGIPTMVAPGKRAIGSASPDWGTAVTQLPWYLYLYYGDVEILREFYPDMKIWVDYISNMTVDYISLNGLGDWCPPGGNEMMDCPIGLSSTAFHFLDLSILLKTAGLLGYESDASFYSARLNMVKEKFNQKFFDKEKNSYGSQTANAMAIQLGLVPDGKAAEVARTLVNDIDSLTNGFIQMGIFGLGRVFPSLAENGEEDKAYKLLTKKGIHSFAYMWENYDATTLWEVLPVDDFYKTEASIRRSHSHPMNSGYDEWFFKGIAGINLDDESPGFKNIIFRPYFTSLLNHAEASYESPYGTIESSWKRESNSFKWDIHIPANSSGDIYIPKIFLKQSMLINGREVTSELTEDAISPGYFVKKSTGSGNFSIIITSEP